MLNLTAELEQAKFALGILRAAGYDAYVTGGALRATVLGGTTGDVDIAVLVDGNGEAEKLSVDLRILLSSFNFKLSNHSVYSATEAFIADWRSGNINVIAYNTNVDKDIHNLTAHYDLNINAFYMTTDGVIHNDSLDVSNPVVRAGKHSEEMCGRLRKERVVRFKDMFAHLTWEVSVDDCTA